LRFLAFHREDETADASGDKVGKGIKFASTKIVIEAARRLFSITLEVVETTRAEQPTKTGNDVIFPFLLSRGGASAPKQLSLILKRPHPDVLPTIIKTRPPALDSNHKNTPLGSATVTSWKMPEWRCSWKSS
jgi:hypothetical protein